MKFHFIAMKRLGKCALLYIFTILIYLRLLVTCNLRDAGCHNVNVSLPTWILLLLSIYICVADNLLLFLWKYECMCESLKMCDWVMPFVLWLQMAWLLCDMLSLFCSFLYFNQEYKNNKKNMNLQVSVVCLISW